MKHLVYLLLVPLSTYLGPLGPFVLFPSLWGIYHWLSSEAYLGTGEEGRRYSAILTSIIGLLTYTNPWCLLGVLAFVVYWARLCL